MRVGEPRELPHTLTSTCRRCILRLLHLPLFLEGNSGKDHRPACPQLAGEDEKSRSRPVSLSLGKEELPGGAALGPPQRAAGPGAPALGSHPRGAGPAPPSKAQSLLVTSCPPDTIALADSRALSSKAKYSLGAQPSVLQRAEAARFRQPAPRAIDQGLLNPYPASTFYPSARLRSQNTSSFCHFSSKLLIRSFG